MNCSLPRGPPGPGPPGAARSGPPRRIAGRKPPVTGANAHQTLPIVIAAQTRHYSPNMPSPNTHEPRIRAVTQPDRPWHKRQAPRGRTVGLLALLCAGLLILASAGAVAQQSDADAKKATEKLFEAAEVGNLEAVQASISAGGDMNAVDDRGLTPADVAADRGHFNVVHFLLSVRNVRKTIGGPGATPLPLAAAAALPSLLATPPAPAAPPGIPRSAPSLPVLSAPLSASPPPQPIGPPRPAQSLRSLDRRLGLDPSGDRRTGPSTGGAADPGHGNGNGGTATADAGRGRRRSRGTGAPPLRCRWQRRKHRPHRPGRPWA